MDAEHAAACVLPSPRSAEADGSGPGVSRAARRETWRRHALVGSLLRQQIRAGSTAERWALFVLGAIDSPSDPKTLSIWARVVHVSRSALCEYCRLVHVSPHDARDFARVLRAICRMDHAWQPEAVMDVADARSLKRLLGRAGLVHAREVPTFDEFFDRQLWIPQHNPGLTALRGMLQDGSIVHVGSGAAGAR